VGEADIFAQRSAKVLEQLDRHKVDALLILNDENSQRANTRWLCGFSGSSSLCLLSPEHRLLITGSIYDIQARQEIKSPWQVHICRTRLEQPEIIKALTVSAIGIVGEHITVENFRNLRRNLRPVKLIALPNILGPIQEIKDELDILMVRKAIESIEQALQHIVTRCIRPGVTELEVKRELAMALPLDAELTFAIIASGPNSAIPHHSPTDRVILNGDIIKLDVGCRIKEYNSDITRVVVVGKATPAQKRMHKAVLEAQSAALAFYTPGTPVKRADEEARRILAAYKYDEKVIYSHCLGHGLGLQIHEYPGVSSRNKERFRVGQVVTCEPGIYIEGWGGMRIEDDVLITKYGHELLTKFPGDLIEI